MGRQRGYDEGEVLDRSAGTFLRAGYEGTSVEELVGATGLHRGSLYQAFGSKRGLCGSGLRDHVKSLLLANERSWQAGHGPPRT